MNYNRLRLNSGVIHFGYKRIKGQNMKMAMKLGVLAIFFGLALTVNSQTNDSIVQLTADSQGLQLMTPDELPASGTFWFIDQYGISVPWPCPPTDTNMPVYQIDDGSLGIFLVDASGGNVAVRRLPGQQITSDSTNEAIVAMATNIVALINSVQETELNRSFAMAMGMDDLFPGDGGDGTNDYTPDGSGFTMPDYGTNLWIAQTVCSNGWLNAIGSNTIGAQSGVGQMVNGGELDLSPLGFSDKIFDHSGQFNRNIQTPQSLQFYANLVTKMFPQ